MNKIVITSIVIAVAGLLVSACASSSPEGEEPTTGSEESAVGYRAGFCDVSVSTGLLTGKCRSCSGMCSLGTTNAGCPAGATPLQGIHSQCGGIIIGYDHGRSCTAYVTGC